MAADWRRFTELLSPAGIGSRAVDLWRFLEGDALSLTDFGKALNAEALGQVSRGRKRALLGYSMGARMALHALLENAHPWYAAVIVSGHPGLKIEQDCARRRAVDVEWASQAMIGSWQNFLYAWNSQVIFNDNSIRSSEMSDRLITRRREVARSFVDWSLGKQLSLWPRLAEISIPVLWVVGENDLKFRALAETAVSQMPNAKLAIALGAGHRVPWEKDIWFAELVVHFLKNERVD